MNLPNNIQADLPEEQISELLKRKKFLEDVRNVWQKTWEKITEYVHPRKANFKNDGTEGETFGENVYNSEPISYNQQLADGLQGYSVSRQIRWTKLHMRDKKLMDQPGVADWLELIEDVLYTAFNLSNFYEAMGEFFLDGGSIGTAHLYSQYDPQNNVIRFTCIHPEEMYIAEDDYGRIDTHVRSYWRSGKAIVSRFGEDRLHPNMMHNIEKDPFKKHNVLHFVFKTELRKLMGVPDLKVNFPWASIYIDPTNKKILSISGYYENPYHTWRWRKNSGETYGRSPSIDSMGDIFQLNNMSGTLSLLSQLTAEPPMWIHEDFEGREELIPRGYNYYSNPQHRIEPIQLGHGYPVTLDMINDTERKIAHRFYVDFFLMLQQLEGQMTAREVMERQGERAAILGAVVGRLNSEVLEPVIRRTLGMLARNGQLPPPPPAIQMGDGGQLEIEFLGPLAQIQKSYYQSQGVSKGFQATMPIFQVKPETMDNFNFDELSRETAESFGMPQKIIEEMRDVQAKRQARAEQQQQMMMAEQKKEFALEAMKNADKLKDTERSGTPLDALNRISEGEGE